MSKARILEVNVAWDDELDAFACPYGVIGEPRTAVHWPMEGNGHDGGSRTRQCVHLLDERAPRCCLFSSDAVARLSYYPYLYTGRVWPAVVSRTGDIVHMAFDRIGEPRFCHRAPTNPPAHRWSYRCHPVRFNDEEEICERVVLGVWAD